MAFFPSLKQNLVAYRSSKVSSHPDCIFEIHQLWQSDFSRVYSNCCCSCSFEAEIIKVGQSSHKMYSNNILNFQEYMPILNAHTKKVWKLIVCISYYTITKPSLITKSVNVLQWKMQPYDIHTFYRLFFTGYINILLVWEVLLEEKVWNCLL